MDRIGALNLRRIIQINTSGRFLWDAPGKPAVCLPWSQVLLQTPCRQNLWSPVKCWRSLRNAVLSPCRLSPCLHVSFFTVLLLYIVLKEKSTIHYYYIRPVAGGRILAVITPQQL